MKTLGLAVASAVLLAGAVLAQAGDQPGGACHAVMKPSKSEVALGDRFTVDVTGQGPAGATWTFPASVEGDQADLRAVPSKKGQAPPPGSQRYDAMALAIGDVTLPTLAVRCQLPGGKQEDATIAPATIKVTSVLPKRGDEQTLADIRPYVPVSAGWVFWVAVGLCILLVGVLVTWLVRHRRRRRQGEEPMVHEPEVPAEVQARQALDRLASAGLLDRGDYRGYYIELTEIAKTYLERRLDAPVAEMTSSEMLGFLHARPELAPVSSPMRDLATVADFVKFARGGGERSDAERHLASVRELVDGIERILAAPASGAEPAAKARRTP
jgi:hypothetical protein